MLGRYRLYKPTLGIVVANRLAIQLPIGTIVEIPITPSSEDRTVEVLCNGKPMLMFVQDLQERASKVALSAKA